MSGVEHTALAQSFVSSPQLMLVPAAVWAIYLIKIINFNSQRLALPENTFVFDLNLLPAASKLSAAVLMIISQFIPAILYGLFLVLMAIKFNFIWSAVQAILFLLIFIVAGSATFLFNIRRPQIEKRISFLKKFFDYRYTKPLIQFYIEWVIRREPLLSFGTKVFSCALLFAVAKLYEAESYDWRLMAMGIVIAFSSNMMIILQLHEFENFHFTLLRNLPLTLTRRFLNYFLVFVVVCFPEIVFIIKYFPQNLSMVDLLSVVALGVSIGVFLYTLLLVDLGKENFSRAVFLYLIVLILSILFKIPAYALAMINLVTGVVIFNSRYYAYQHKPENEELK